MTVCVNWGTIGEFWPLQNLGRNWHGKLAGVSSITLKRRCPRSLI